MISKDLEWTVSIDMEGCKAERRWDKEGKDPGNSSGAQHRKYGSTEKRKERDPKPVK